MEKNPYLCKLFLYHAGIPGVSAVEKFAIVGVTPLNSGAIEIDRHIEGGKFEKTMYAPGSWNKVQVVGDIKKKSEEPITGMQTANFPVPVPANDRDIH